MIKTVVITALVAVALADKTPDPYKAPEPVVYKPAPAPYNPPAPAPYRPRPAYKPNSYKEPELPPQPFAYNYGVRDQYTGADFDKKEEQDAYGNLNGEYRVQLPDGRTQIVSYIANEDGFVADVKYEGEAVYPPEPAEGYGKRPAPKYAPAHAPKYVPAAAPKYVPAAAPKYVPAPPSKYEA